MAGSTSSRPTVKDERAWTLSLLRAAATGPSIRRRASRWAADRAESPRQTSTAMDGSTWPPRSPADGLRRTRSTCPGTGDGTFDHRPGTTWHFSRMDPRRDFNQDSRPDLVWSTRSQAWEHRERAVEQGRRHVPPCDQLRGGTYPRFRAHGRFQRDGKLDFAAAGSSLTSVLLGPATEPSTCNPHSRSAGVTHWRGRLQRRHRLDLAALGGSYDAGAVSVLLGTGTGSFNGPTSYSIGAALAAIAAGDLDKR